MNSQNQKMNRCLVQGCARETSRFFIMCVEHWKLVPLSVKDKLYEAFVVIKKDPDQYRRAVKEAVAKVESQEW